MARGARAGRLPIPGAHRAERPAGPGRRPAPRSANASPGARLLGCKRTAGRAGSDPRTGAGGRGREGPHPPPARVAGGSHRGLRRPSCSAKQTPHHPEYPHFQEAGPRPLCSTSWLGRCPPRPLSAPPTEAEGGPGPLRSWVCSDPQPWPGRSRSRGRGRRTGVGRSSGVLARGVRRRRPPARACPARDSPSASGHGSAVVAGGGICGAEGQLRNGSP